MKSRGMIGISGEPGVGKTTSWINNLPLEECFIINLDKKTLPIADAGNSKIVTINDPYELIRENQELNKPSILGIFFDEKYKKNLEKYNYVIIDAITSLSMLFKREHIKPLKDQRAGWAEYGYFFNELIETLMEISKIKTVILISHLKHHTKQLNGNPYSDGFKHDFNTALADEYTKYFTYMITAMKLNANYFEENEILQNKYLNITDDDIEGGKYVFNVNSHKDTEEYFTRMPYNFMRDDTGKKIYYIDQDISIVLNEIDKFYKKDNK